MPRSSSHLDPAVSHEIKVAILCWVVVAGMCVAIANALAATVM